MSKGGAMAARSKGGRARLIANPNCTTAIAVMALWPLLKKYGLKRCIMSTYQVRALAAAGGDVNRLTLVDQAIVDACLSRELKQQKDPLGEVEFDAWCRGRAI